MARCVRESVAETALESGFAGKQICFPERIIYTGEKVKTFLKGILIGLANIIPGVSGGTLALILGIYDRLINALHNINVDTVKACFGLLRMTAESRESFKREWKSFDGTFLMVLGLGAVVAIVTLARLMDFLLREHLAPSYAFFFGLVVLSMVFPYRILKRKSWKEALAFLLAAVMTVSLSFAVSNESKIEKAEAKLKIEQAEKFSVGLDVEQGHSVISFENPGTMKLIGIFFAATLAISAMVLPGISGSFVLLLLGVYFDILAAINERQVIVLAVFALGAVTGLLGFARVMNVLLKRWYSTTMAFMIGLMAGSLWALWPFKRVMHIGDEIVYLNNIMPGSALVEWLPSLVAMLVGVGIIMISLRFESKSSV